MSCRLIERLLIDSLDGQLPAGKERRLREHLAGCHACRSRFEEWAGVRRSLAQIQDVAPHSSLTQRALARWHSEPSRSGGVGRFLFPAVAVLALLAITRGAILLPPTGEHSAAPTPRKAPPGTGPGRQVTAAPTLPPRQPARDEQIAPAPGRPKRSVAASPALDSTPPPGMSPVPLPDDSEYLDGRDPELGAWMMTGSSWDETAREWLGRKLPRMRDDFVRPPLPRLASTDRMDPAVREAIRQAEKEAKVVDARLFGKVTLQLKGASLDEFCRELEQQTQVRLRASRGVQDEKVTVFVKEKPAREVMRAVARLFGYLWERQGEEGKYRYTLVQNLREQLAEQEMRDRDLNAAVLGLDQAMQAYAPYADKSVEALKARLPHAQGPEKERIAELVRWGGWGVLQVYRTLSPADFATLREGGKVRYGFTRFDQDRNPLPEELLGPFMQAFDTENIAGGERYRDPAVRPWVSFAIDRAELGQVKLRAEVGVSFADGKGIGHLQDLAVSRSPSTAKPDNTGANKALNRQPPFTQVVTLKPKPSCPHFAEGAPPPTGHLRRSDPLAAQPHVTSADVWEAVHRATGLPVVADFYTSLHPVGAVTVEKKPLFEALCTVGDPMRVRWKKDGAFLLARSTSYFWDKLKEVPERHLRRWQEGRKKEGALPLEQVLEIAALSDHQLNSREVGRAVEHCWGIHEWGILGEGLPREVVRQIPSETRPWFRLLTLLNRAQLDRVLGAEGLPVPALAPAHQQEVARLDVSLLNSVLRAAYVPDGWYLWMPRFPIDSEYRDFRVYSKLPIVADRRPEAALAAARRVYAEVRPQDIARQQGTLGVWFVNPEGLVVRDWGKPSVRYSDLKRLDQ